MTRLLESPLTTLLALGFALSLGAGCSAFDGEPLSAADMLESEPEARPAAGPPVQRVSRAELAIEPASATLVTSPGVLSAELADLAGERMSFQSQAIERLHSLDLRIAAAKRALASADAQAAADVNTLLTTFGEARSACVKEQDGLVIAPNDSWTTAKEQVLGKLDRLERYVAKIESTLGIGSDNEL